VGGGVLRRLGAALACLLAVAAVPAAAADSNFQAYEAYRVGSSPDAVAIGDVTGDGLNDVVMTTHFYFDDANDYRLWVFAGRSDGEPAAPVSYPTAATYASGPDTVAVGDVTGDGKADVVLGLAGLGVQVFPQAAGALGTPSFTAIADSGRLRLGRLDGDARLDVATLGWGTNTVSVLLNDGAGGWRAPVTYAAQHGGYDDLEVGDVTGDGRDDLVVMSGQLYAAPNVSVLPQLAAGGFGAAAEYRVGTNVNTQGIGIGDVTGDGRKDVVASYGGNRPGSALAVFAQTATGLLGPPAAYPSYDIPEPVEVADVDLDGRADVVTLHGGWNQAGVYRQQPGGTLGSEELSAIPYASHYEPHGLAVGDVDGNGSADVALADYNHGLVVLRNVRAATPPPSADVGVDVTAPSERVKPGKAFSFVAAVTNAGPDATAATLVVTVSGSPSGVAASGPGCTASAATVTCALGTLPKGSRTTVSVYGTAGARGSTLTATGTVDGVAADSNSANDRDSASIQVR
jgi:uncharacterized protein DUF11/VCBS repeat protein